jgi:hypothetical protein
MAVYSNLPVFKASYDLMIEVFNMCGGLPKDYKYTVGERLKNILMDLMIGIYEANSSDDKAEILDRCRKYVVETQLYLRMLHDLKRLSTKRFAALSDNVDVISRQVTAWHKSKKAIAATSGVP